MSKTTMKILNSSQMHEMENFGAKVNKLGVNFSMSDAEGNLLLECNIYDSEKCRENRIKTAIEALNKHQTSENIYEHEDTLAVVLTTETNTLAVASISPVKDEHKEYFRQMLLLLAEKFQDENKSKKEIEMFSTELSQTYEELILLHKLSTNMKITEPDTNFLQMACDSLTDIVLVEGIAILFNKIIDNEKQLALIAGSGVIDVSKHATSLLYERLVEETTDGKEALIDSEVDGCFKYQWAENIKSIIAVPLYGKDKIETEYSQKTDTNNNIIGMMVAINRINKTDFDSADIKLFNSVANNCAVFIENGRLFKELKQLLIGSFKALTSSIDAKDEYTRGHSERVAFISQWIAERLTGQDALDTEQIHKVYLAGLLHDIGKIGIDEKVLRKTGKLNDEEFESIKKHPAIGAGILKEIKQMRDIVDGALCHHERIDGNGYPNGLTKNHIPVIGKIICIADGFDAMTSKRTYRRAMSPKEALTEIEKTLGTQFDEKIGRVFLESDVDHLWEIIQNGFTDDYGMRSFAEYGSIAVGTLVK